MSLDNYKSHTGLRTRPEYKRKAVYTLHEDVNNKYGAAHKLGKNGSDVDLEVIREVTKSPADYTSSDSEKGAAYSLRRVSDKPNADQKIFDSADNLIQGSISTNVSEANAVPIDSVHTGLVYRTFANVATPSDNSIVFQDNLIRIKANNPGSGLGAYTQVLRFDGLGTDATYTIKGEARIIGVDLGGTDPVAQAYFDAQDGTGGVGVITSSEFQPFSITHKPTLASHDFIDLACRIASNSSATDLTGFATAEYRNIQIIKNPTQVVKVRRGDGVEADVFVDNEGNTTVNSPIQNTVEHVSPPSAGTGFDTHFTPEKTLGKFLQTKETQPITMHSSYEATAESFTLGDNGFTVKALDDVSGASQSNVRVTRTIDNKIEEYDALHTKYTISFNVTEFVTDNPSNPARVTFKAGNSSSGGSTWFFADADGTQNTAASNITGTGKHSFTLYGRTDNTNNTDGGIDYGFKSLVFLVNEGCKLSVENLELTIDHDARVTCWYDQVGELGTSNEKNARQSVEREQPWLAKRGEIITLDNKAAVEFEDLTTYPAIDTDSDGDVNYFGTHLTTALTVSANDAASIYLSASSNDPSAVLGSDYWYTNGATGTSNSISETFGIGVIASRMSPLTASTAVITNNDDQLLAKVDNKAAIMSLIGGTTNTTFSMNGNQWGSITTPTNAAGNHNITTGTNASIGCHGSNGSFISGKIHELIIYNKDTSADRPYIESNMAAYYGNVDVPRSMAAIRGVSGSGGNDAAKILLGIYLDKYEEAVNGEVIFKYFVPEGHAAVGKYWHIGASSETHTGTASEPIVGGQWTEATVSFGSLFGGLDKAGAGAVPNRFLSMSFRRQREDVLTGTITNVTPNEDILLADIVVYSISDFTSQTDLDSKTEGGYSKPNYTYAHN